MNKQRRRQAFSRRLREKRAVSPVVATLILILIAVAAAAALYLWLVAWQGGVTKTIGSPAPQYTISIGGSTTVYPLDVIAVQWFEQNNSGVTVSNQQGGSGAGAISVCAGAVDIGASSSIDSATTLAGDGCPPSTVQTPIGYDGVDMIQDPSNGHGIVSLNQTLVFALYYCDGGGTSYNAGASVTYTPPGWLAASANTGGSNNCGGDTWSWGELPQPAGCVGASESANTSAGAATYTTSCTFGDKGTGTLGYVVATKGVYGTWDYTAGTAVDPNAAKIPTLYHRQDNSGTEQSFVSLLMGTNCGTDKGNELSECGISATGEVGNPALLTAVVADPNGIGFNSNGIIATTYGSSKVSTYAVAFQGPGQAYGVVPGVTTILPAVSAQCGTSPAPTCTESQYFGWRQLEYITVGTPTGESARFIQFVTGSEVNQDLCIATGYISIYSPGAPPPTPIVD